MDRAFAKWIVYVAVGLAVYYAWIHLNDIRTAVNSVVTNLWR